MRPLRKRPASCMSSGIGSGSTSTSTSSGQARAAPAGAAAAAGGRPPSLRARRRAVASSVHAAVALALLLLLGAVAPAAQALSPSKMIASFAAQQRRAHAAGYQYSTSGRTAASLASATRHGPVPPKHASGRLPRTPAFVGADGGGGGDFASWTSGGAGGGAGAQVWQPPRPLLGGIKGGPGDMAGSMGVSGLSGMAAGYVAKRFGRMLSFACGFVLVSMKVAEELGYISVNWARIEDDTRALGRSLWGKGGTVRAKAEKFASSWQRELGQHAGIAGSFAAGFAYGFRA